MVEADPRRKDKGQVREDPGIRDRGGGWRARVPVAAGGLWEGLAWEVADLGASQPGGGGRSVCPSGVPEKAGCGGLEMGSIPSECASRTTPAEGGRLPRTACLATRLSPIPLPGGRSPRLQSLWGELVSAEVAQGRAGTRGAEAAGRGQGTALVPAPSGAQPPRQQGSVPPRTEGPRPHLQLGAHRLLPALGPASPPSHLGGSPRTLRCPPRPSP